MRILVASALLLMTAACVPPPPPPEAAVPPLPGAPTPLIAAAPVPPPPAPPPPPPVAVGAPPPAAPTAAMIVPNPFAPLFGQPGSGRLNLSNISYDRAHVQTVTTSYPDCAVHDGAPISDFAMPLNATRVIDPPPGSDVCWRIEVVPNQALRMSRPPIAGWSQWNRVYTSTGRVIDARL